MSINSAIVRELIAAGVTGDDLVAALERIEAASLPVRSNNAIRQARYREKQKEGVTSNVTNVTSNAKEKSPTPPKEITTTNLTVVSSSPPSPPIQTDDLQDAFDAWNVLAAETGIPGIQRLNDQRRKALKARLRELGGMDGWTACLEKIRAGPLLLGQAGSGWVATFDWVLIPKNLTKIMEGNYDRRSSPQQQSTLETIYHALAGGLGEGEKTAGSG